MGRCERTTQEDVYQLVVEHRCEWASDASTQFGFAKKNHPVAGVGDTVGPEWSACRLQGPEMLRGVCDVEVDFSTQWNTEGFGEFGQSPFGVARQL